MRVSRASDTGVPRPTTGGPALWPKPSSCLSSEDNAGGAGGGLVSEGAAVTRQVAAEAVGAEHLPSPLGGPLRMGGAAFEPWPHSPLRLHRCITSQPSSGTMRHSSLPRPQLTVQGPLTRTFCRALGLDCRGLPLGHTLS